MNKNTLKITLTALVVGALLLSGCQQTQTPGRSDNGQSTTQTNAYGEKTPVISTTSGSLILSSDSEKSTGSGQKTSSTDTSSTSKKIMQLQPPQTGDTVATIETSMGTIKIRLFANLVPETVKNFTTLAKEGKYENVPFHRVINDFMIQTGDFSKKNGSGGYSYKGPDTTINDEFSNELKHYNGTVSMANRGPNTNGSQFFIVSSQRDNSYLNNHYSVFGQVYEGQDIVDKIADVDTDMSDKPLKEVTIKKISISTF